MIQSPLNYTGGKFKLLPQILPYFPEDIDIFVDLFCGGCNVGVNIDANTIIYNDLNQNLLYLYNALKNLDKESTFEWIYQIIDKYQLSLVSKNGYDYYKCESSKGLGSYNKEKFLQLRAEFNQRKANGNFDYYYYIMLYVDKTLKHSFVYLFLRLLVEKTLVEKYSIDTTRYDQLGSIISQAFPADDVDSIRKRVRLTSKKTLINEFNHFEGNLSIFQPAIDITEKALGAERTDVLTFVDTIKKS